MKRKTTNRLLSTLLTLALVVGEMGSTGISAFAAGEETEGEYGYEDALISSDEENADTYVEADGAEDETAWLYDAAEDDSMELISEDDEMQADDEDITVDDESDDMDIDRTVYMGTAVLGTKANKEDAATVAFGGQKWNVIGYDGSGVAAKAGTATLLQWDCARSGVTFSDNYTNEYSKSNLKTILDDIYNGFPDLEKESIVKRTLETGEYKSDGGGDCDGIAGAPVPDAGLWPLSTKEAGDTDATIRSLRLSSGYNLIEWWLRSPGSDDSDAAFVQRGYGHVCDYGDHVSHTHALRPAFYLDLSSVIFSYVYNGTDLYKLTLRDTNMTARITSGQKASLAGSELSIPYQISGSDAYFADAVSVLILNKEYTFANTNGASTVYYGRLDTGEQFFSNGTGKVTLPSGLDMSRWGYDYYVYLIPEIINGNNQADYAGNPIQITKDQLNIIQTYTVSFDLQGVTVDNPKAYSTQTVVQGKKAADPGDPTAAGYAFRGWYTSKDFNSASRFSFARIVVRDVTLYARWDKITLQGVTIDSAAVNYSNTEHYYQISFGGINLDWAGSAGRCSYKASSALYTDSDCTKVLSDEPLPDKLYYVKLQIRNMQAGDSSIDFSKLNKSNCSLSAFEGYNTATQSVKKSIDPDGHEQVIIVFELTGNKVYTLDSASFLAGFVIQYTGGRYCLDDVTETFSWENGDEPADDKYSQEWSDIFTDVNCTVLLDHDPVPETEGYYVKYTLNNIPGDGTAMQLGKVKKEDCTLLMLDGWYTECLSLKAYAADKKDEISDRLELKFYIVKNRPEGVKFSTQPVGGTADENGDFTFSWGTDKDPVTLVLQYIEGNQFKDGADLIGKTSYTVHNDTPATIQYIIKAQKEGYTTYSNPFSIKWPDTYSLSSFEAAASDVVLAYRGTYYLSNVIRTLSWKDGKEPYAIDYSNYPSCLYEDKSCTQELTTAPVQNGTYYMNFTLERSTRSVDRFDFSTVGKDGCLLELNGYHTECVDVQRDKYSDGREYVRIFFKLDKTSADIVKYPVWVSGTQVTDSNKDNVLNDSYTTPQVVYTPAEAGKPAVLTLTNATIECFNPHSGHAETYAGIYSAGNDLKIELVGMSTINGNDMHLITGIDVSGAELTFTGTGTVSAYAGENDENNDPSIAITADCITIESGDVYARGAKGTISIGINATNELNLKGGRLFAEGGESSESFGIRAQNILWNSENAEIKGNTRAFESDPGITDTSGLYIRVSGNADGSGAAEWDKTSALGGTGSTYKYVKLSPETVKYPVIDDTGIPLSVKAGEYYSAKVGYTGGEYPFTLEVSGLPDWLEYDEAYRVIEGEADQPGNYSFTVKVTDKNGATDEKTFNIVVLPVEYTVSFDANGHGSAPEAQNVAKGKKAKMPAAPAADEYEFGGWYTTADCKDEERFDFSTPITEDITLYAKWSLKGYSVSFDLNGKGDGSLFDVQSVKHGSKVLRPASDPVVENWKFKDWYCEAECVNVYDFETPVTESLTLYAGWEKKEGIKYYNVSFDTRGHGGSVAAQTIAENDKVSKPADPHEAGWIFIGWYTDEAYTTEYDFDTPVTADIVLYARWTKEGVPLPTHSPLDSVPEIKADTTDLWLVKGQKFIIGTDWEVADKDSKKFVSISKKGQLKAKKVDGGKLVKIKNKNVAREITIHISKPTVTSKKLKLDIVNANTAAYGQIVINKDEHLDVLYYSAAPDVATVDQTGKVTAVGKGKAKITAYINGSAYNCSVTVKETATALERTLHMTTGSSKTISVKIKDVKKPEWKSESENVASVNKKKVKAGTAAGTTYLTASGNGVNYKINVFVEDTTVKISGGEGISLVKKSATKYDLVIPKGKETDVLQDLVYQDVVFKSSKPDTVFIDEYGHVYAREKGKGKFTAKINGKTVTINVQVSE